MASLWAESGKEARAAGDTAAATKFYRRSLDLDPDYAPAHLGMGDCLADEGVSAEALGHWSRALEDGAACNTCCPRCIKEGRSLRARNHSADQCFNHPDPAIAKANKEAALNRMQSRFESKLKSNSTTVVNREQEQIDKLVRKLQGGM